MKWMGRAAKAVVGGIVVLATTALYAYAVVMVLNAQDEGMVWLKFGFVLFGWFPIFFIHELGHALAAQAAGWRTIVFHVAPWAIKPKPFRLSFAGNLGGPDVGGYVLSIPKRPETYTKLRRVLASAGGPIANWLSAFVFLALAFFWAIGFADGFEPDRDLVTAVLAASGLYSIACALENTWPKKRSSGHSNDGAAILEICREQNSAPPHPISFAFVLVHLGVPRKDWDRWITEGVEQAKTVTGSQPTAHLIWLLACLTEKDDQGAITTLQSLIALAPETAETKIVSALIAALVNDDTLAAENALASIKSLEGLPPQTLHLRQLALAAIIARENGPGAINLVDDVHSQMSGALDYPGGLWSVLSARVVAMARSHAGDVKR